MRNRKKNTCSNICPATEGDGKVTVTKGDNDTYVCHCGDTNNTEITIDKDGNTVDY